MKHKIIFHFLILVTAISNNVSAQRSVKLCGTMEEQEKLFHDHPELKQAHLQEQVRLEELDKAAAADGYRKDSRSITPVYIIPVVFHVLHQGGPENISDEQIFDEMRILNEDYRKLNADTNLTVPVFVSIADDAGIEFRLAKKDPNGNCTNGIDRIYTALANNANDNSKINQWDPTKYLNIWTAKDPLANGAAAYAHFPGGPSATDGIMALNNYVGSIGTSDPTKSRTLTHEIGHYLNLWHTWGSTNAAGVACGDDGVSDTPITKGFNLVCPLTNCQICNPPIEENVQNYMDYSYCETMFTTGQALRMRNCLTGSLSHRDSLITPYNQYFTGVNLPDVLCHVDFSSNSSTNFICEGDSITYSYDSYNGRPTSWNWVFQGGTPFLSTDSTPSIVYPVAGSFTTSLIASNATGSDTAIKTNYIHVMPSTAMYNGSIYSEGYEGAAIPNSDWVVDNHLQVGNTWEQTAAAAYSGSKSVVIVNTAAEAGAVDELIGPSVNMTSFSGTINLTFKEAYARRIAASADVLKVMISTNCGKTWSTRLVSNAAALATAPDQGGNFVPAANQWSTKTVALSAYGSITSLLFKFQFTSDGGNNIYIDDINIEGITGVDDLSGVANFGIHPNPANENTVIDFNLIHNAPVTITLRDIVGQETSSIYYGVLAAGKHQYGIEEKKKLAAGVYMVELTAGEARLVRKLVVD